MAETTEELHGHTITRKNGVVSVVRFNKRIFRLYDRVASATTKSHGKIVGFNDPKGPDDEFISVLWDHQTSSVLVGTKSIK